MPNIRSLCSDKSVARTAPAFGGAVVVQDEGASFTPSIPRIHSSEVVDMRGIAEPSSQAGCFETRTAKLKRVMHAMLQMSKIDIEGLRRAYEGDETAAPATASTP